MFFNRRFLRQVPRWLSETGISKTKTKEDILILTSMDAQTPSIFFEFIKITMSHLEKRSRDFVLCYLSFKDFSNIYNDHRANIYGEIL